MSGQLHVGRHRRRGHDWPMITARSFLYSAGFVLFVTLLMVDIPTTLHLAAP